MAMSHARRGLSVAAPPSQEGFGRVLRVFTQTLKVVTVAALSVVVLVTGVWAFSYATELARPSDTGEPVMLTVFEDQTDAEVADELAAQGLIRSTLLFQGQFRMSGGALVPGHLHAAQGDERAADRRPHHGSGAGRGGAAGGVDGPGVVRHHHPGGMAHRADRRGVRAARRRRRGGGVHGRGRDHRPLAVRLPGRSAAGSLAGRISLS